MEPAWEWHVGDPIGTGSDVGAPEVPYMSYGPKRRESSAETEEREKDDERERKADELERRSRNISEEAWKLREEGRYDEALIFIKRAIECCEWTAEPWNVKAIILEDMKNYEGALENYDRAIGLGSSEVYRHNKARCLVRYCSHLKDDGDRGHALDVIDQSLLIFKELDDKDFEDRAWNLKGMLFESFNNFEGAFDCYKKALELSAADSEMKSVYRKNRDRIIPLIDSSERICPSCGGRLEVADNFCLKCGARVGDKPDNSD